jgi:hypothetical protein
MIRHLTTAERLVLINQVHAEGRLMYERGRSDRVMGLSPALKYRENLYYFQAYRTEMAKEAA